MRTALLQSSGRPGSVAANAVWGVMHHLDGGTDPANPGPGDVYDEIAPVELPED